MKKTLQVLLLFTIFGYYQGFSQSKETTLYIRKELVKQRDELIRKAEQIQKRIDSIDGKINGNTITQYFTKSVNHSSETKYLNSFESNSKSKKRSTSRYTRTYYRGPRGGCYYVNSNGNKTYVARSMCD